MTASTLLAASTTESHRPDVRVATLSDRDRVVSTLVLAFAADPVARWMYPDADAYLAHFPRFVMAFGGRALAHGTAHQAGDFAGAALWLPPGVHPDESALEDLLHATLPERTLGDVLGLLDEMDRYHPAEPHWHLPMIGVQPARQGRGLGSALLRHALAACDRAGLAAHLESSSPANIPLYERHGFELRGTIRRGGSPPLFPMTRQPR